jgi:hypothetical protein
MLHTWFLHVLQMRSCRSSKDKRSSSVLHLNASSCMYVYTSLTGAAAPSYQSPGKSRTTTSKHRLFFYTHDSLKTYGDIGKHVGSLYKTTNYWCRLHMTVAPAHCSWCRRACRSHWHCSRSHWDSCRQACRSHWPKSRSHWSTSQACRSHIVTSRGWWSHWATISRLLVLGPFAARLPASSRGRRGFVGHREACIWIWNIEFLMDWAHVACICMFAMLLLCLYMATHHVCIYYMLAHVAGLPSARASINTQQVQNDTIYIYIYISKAHLCADMHMYDVDVHGPFYMHA